MDRADHSRPDDTNSTFVEQIPTEQHKKPYGQQIGRPDRMFTLRYGSQYIYGCIQTDELTLHPHSNYQFLLNQSRQRQEDQEIYLD
jgi:hypothetical protein